LKRKDGGMSLKDLYTSNCLVARLYKARYLPKCDVLEAKKKEQLKFYVEEYL